MSVYVIGIIATVITICFHSWANILDHYFSATIFKRLAVLIFFAGFVNLFFLPVLFIIDKPGIPSLISFSLILCIALINVLYQYPYYWSLRTTDTSVVVSLFSLGKIFTPLFAYFIVGEHLKDIQYAGFFIIISSSVLLTLDFRQIRLNKEFFYMLAVSLLLTIQFVLYKYLSDHSVKWGTLVFWVAISDFTIAALFMFHRKNYDDLRNSLSNVKSQGKLFVLNQFLTWGGDVVGVSALYYLPVSLFEGIESTQPIFVLIFALLFAKKFPDIFKEYIGRDKLTKKVILFLLIIIGTILII